MPVVSDWFQAEVCLMSVGTVCFVLFFSWSVCVCLCFAEMLYQYLTKLKQSPQWTRNKLMATKNKITQLLISFISLPGPLSPPLQLVQHQPHAPLCLLKRWYHTKKVQEKNQPQKQTCWQCIGVSAFSSEQYSHVQLLKEACITNKL